jgi:molecular chaperone GrpE
VRDDVNFRDNPMDDAGDAERARDARAASVAQQSQPQAGGEGEAPAAAEQAELYELQQQLEDQRDKYLRLAAEYDNYRKRVAKERQDMGPRAQADLLRHLLDSLDDLGRVAHVDVGATDVASVVQGVDLVEQKMLKALSAAGLEVVNPVDDPFNPELHEAIATQPALSPEDDHIVAQVYQPGYVFKGQLLRPARVVVKQWNE